MKPRTVFLAFLLVVAAAASAEAGFQVFNTGVDAAGNVLLSDTIGDPHYALVSVPGGSTNEIRTKSSAGGFPASGHGPFGWEGYPLGDNSTSSWIGPNNDSQLDGPDWLYRYQTTFLLPTDGEFYIRGQWATDNKGRNIYLNHVACNPQETPEVGFFNWWPFDIHAMGYAGVNTLDFVVENTGGPTALRVEITHADFTPYTRPVPEAGSLVVWSFCVAAGAAVAWRRHRHAA